MRFTYLFDKQEHPREPGGEFLGLIDVQFRGPHPFELITDEEFCACSNEAAVRALGGGTAPIPRSTGRCDGDPVHQK